MKRDPIDDWLSRVNERDLHEAVRRMLLASGAEYVASIHGPHETGRDLVFRQRHVLAGDSWKAVHIRGGLFGSEPGVIKSLVQQCRLAIEHPFVDDVGRGHRLDQVILVSAQALPNRVKEELNRHWETNGRVVILEEQGLADLLRKYTPNIMAMAPSPDISLVHVIPDVTPQLLQALREDPHRLKQLTPEHFEHLVAERLDNMGYDVTLTGSTTRKDGGVDIIAVPREAGAGTFLLAGQVKHHSGDQKSGRPDVDRLLSLKNGIFRLGLLVTNTEFTKDAEWIARKGDNQFFARLRDFEDLKRWLENDFSDEREFRELPDEIELAPGVRIKLPFALKSQRS
jgi:hypothetical protein